MSKTISLLFVLAIPFLSQGQVDVSTVDIPVPVRVMEGDKFIDNLTTGDFELLEDGKPQEIQALYLIKGSNILSRETRREFNPILSRHFFFLFQLIEYNAKLAEMINHLFQNVLLPTDNLYLQTPMKNYSLTPQAMAKKPKEALAKEMNSLLRKDILNGSSEYNSLLRDLRRLVRSISGGNMARDIDSDMTDSSSGIEFLLNRYKETSKKMELNRLMDENKIVRFAQALKGIEGQKFIFFIYQREFRPEIQTMTLNTLMNQYSENPNITSDLHDLFQGYSRDFTVNIDLVNKTFANSSVQFNLIYIHKTPENISGITLREQSEDVFKAYSQVAQATGGTVDSSQNPAAGFQNAMTKADSYYLLYYSPLGYKKDGQFKAITVKVKNPAHSIHHRLGYFAN